MLYWGIILFICIIVFVVSLKALNKSCWDSTLYLVSTLLTGVVAVIIALAMLLTTCEYRSFLASFETQRTIITQMSQTHQFNDNTLIYVADMIDANQKLAEIQGSKKAWADGVCTPIVSWMSFLSDQKTKCKRLLPSQQESLYFL